MSIFHLKIKAIDPEGGRYSVLAEDLEDAVPDTPEIVPFVPDSDFQKLIKRLHSRNSFRFMNYVNLESACTLIGEKLFETFFKGQANERYQRYKTTYSPRRIALHIPPDLYYLPWEVLRDPIDSYGQFISVQGSVIRYDGELPNSRNTLSPPLESPKFLLLMSSPQDRSSIGDFEPLSEHDALELVNIQPATYENFTKGIKNTDQRGLVFFGHGDIGDDRGTKQGTLVFVREERRRFQKRYWSDPHFGYIVGNDIGKIETEMQIACILACESAWADSQVSFQNSITGALLRRTRLAFVIGAQTPIEFLAAQELFETMLSALAVEGLPLDLAIGNAREAIMRLKSNAGEAANFSDLDWWVPVLYARSVNFHIFPKRSNTIAIPPGVSAEKIQLDRGHDILTQNIEIKDYVGAGWRSLKKLFGPSNSESVREIIKR